MTEDVKDEAEEVVEKVEQEAVVTLSPDEERASARGWKSKEKFIEEGGKEEEWKPAKAFNEFGELKDKLIETEKNLKKANKTVQQVVDHHRNVRQAAVEEALKLMKAERDKALEDQDFAAAEKIRDKIQDTKEQFSKGQAVEEFNIPEEKEPDPEFHAFMDRNPWYRPGGKDEMSQEADALGKAYADTYFRQHGVLPAFKDVISKVEKTIRASYPEKFEKPKTGPVSGGNASGASATRTKATLSDQEREIAKVFGMTEDEYAKERDSGVKSGRVR